MTNALASFVAGACQAGCRARWPPSGHPIVAASLISSLPLKIDHLLLFIKARHAEYSETRPRTVVPSPCVGAEGGHRG